MDTHPNWLCWRFIVERDTFNDGYFSINVLRSCLAVASSFSSNSLFITMLCGFLLSLSTMQIYVLIGLQKLYIKLRRVILTFSSLKQVLIFLTESPELCSKTTFLLASKLSLGIIKLPLTLTSELKSQHRMVTITNGGACTVNKQTYLLLCPFALLIK